MTRLDAQNLLPALSFFYLPFFSFFLIYFIMYLWKKSLFFPQKYDTIYGDKIGSKSMPFSIKNPDKTEKGVMECTHRIMYGLRF